ncbi:unannotated protein [freshwater metagenome]|uniref:Unannotated protein n=1 Tax=freshwater metagenome TaxID=449393 RepID=A0A6J7KG12_9ZZZZ
MATTRRPNCAGDRGSPDGVQDARCGSRKYGAFGSFHGVQSAPCRPAARTAAQTAATAARYAGSLPGASGRAPSRACAASHPSPAAPAQVGMPQKEMSGR